MALLEIDRMLGAARFAVGAVRFAATRIAAPLSLMLCSAAAVGRGSALFRISLLTLISSVTLAAASKPDALSTVAERSGFRVTGRYEEVERLCPEYAKAWSDAVRCTEFGRTPEGRPMLALVVSRTGALTPED